MSINCIFYFAIYLCIMINLMINSVATGTNEYYNNITPGSLNETIIFNAATEFSLGEDLVWLSKNTRFFNFSSNDQHEVILQAYDIKSTSAKPNGDVLVFLSGYTEVAIKYASYFKYMSSLGYRIMSFDKRGQGFSGLTKGGYNDGSVTYISNIENTFVKDLEQFINEYVLPVTKSQNSKIVYSANSFGCLIGLTYHLQQPHIISKFILFAPAIRLKIDMPVEYLIYFLHYSGIFTLEHALGWTTLAVRFSKELDASVDHLTHSKSNFELWSKLRDIFPYYLKIAGATFKFLYEFLSCSDQLIQKSSKITTDMLIFQAGDDSFVDNESINNFFASINSRFSKKIKFLSAYHELLSETDDVTDVIKKEIIQFLTRTSSENPDTTITSISQNFQITHIESNSKDVKKDNEL